MMDSKQLPISGRLWVVRSAEHLVTELHPIIERWPKHHKEHLGDQLLRSIDSIGANVSEGNARMHLKERLHFFSIAQGSVEESIFWLRRARDRELITQRQAGIYVSLVFKIANGIRNLMGRQRDRLQGKTPTAENLGCGRTWEADSGC
jgi:four helix bundle protein